MSKERVGQLEKQIVLGIPFRVLQSSLDNVPALLALELSTSVKTLHVVAVIANYDDMSFEASSVLTEILFDSYGWYSGLTTT